MAHNRLTAGLIGSVAYRKATISWGPRGGGSVIICHCPTQAVDDLATAVEMARALIKDQLP